MKIEHKGDRLVVDVPYNATFATRARKMGGRFSPGGWTWSFEVGAEAQVRRLCLETYGWDGLPSDQAVSPTPGEVKAVLACSDLQPYFLTLRDAHLAYNDLLSTYCADEPLPAELCVQRLALLPLYPEGEVPHREGEQLKWVRFYSMFGALRDDLDQALSGAEAKPELLDMDPEAFTLPHEIRDLDKVASIVSDIRTNGPLRTPILAVRWPAWTPAYWTPIAWNGAHRIAAARVAGVTVRTYLISLSPAQLHAVIHSPALAKCRPLTAAGALDFAEHLPGFDRLAIEILRGRR